MIVGDADLFNAAPMTEWRVLIGIDSLIGIDGQARTRSTVAAGHHWMQ